MATFKAGQRVRVRSDIPLRQVAEWARAALGQEAIIVARSDDSIKEWILSIVINGRHVKAASAALIPLTDPSADEWADAQIAKLKQLGPLPVKEVA